MSIQWTVIAGYLYFEIGIVIIMMLPLFSPRRWHQFFKSRLFAMFQEHAAVYFYVLLGVLSLFLFDAVREIRKYSHTPESGHVHLTSEMKGSVKLFRAQRNFYITGFAIFLAFVIRRLVTMLIIQDELSVKAANILKEAAATVELATKTALGNSMKANELQNYKDTKQELELTQNLLEVEKIKVKEIEEEATKWRLKYEEIAVSVNGKGDN